MKQIHTVLSAAFLFAVGMLGSVIAAMGQVPRAVPTVDLDRFSGSWYEIAHLPEKREKVCIADVVILVAQADKAGHLQLVHSCRAKDEYRNITNAGIRVEKGSAGAKLKVTYLWPFSETEWIIDLGPEYEWVVIGSPNHKLLSVLSRSRSMSPELLTQIKQKVAAEGYATDKIVSVLQTGG